MLLDDSQLIKVILWGQLLITGCCVKDLRRTVRSKRRRRRIEAHELVLLRLAICSILGRLLGLSDLISKRDTPSIAELCLIQGQCLHLWVNGLNRDKPALSENVLDLLRLLNHWHDNLLLLLRLEAIRGNSEGRRLRLLVAYHCKRGSCLDLRLHALLRDLNTCCGAMSRGFRHILRLDLCLLGHCCQSQQLARGNYTRLSHLTGLLNFHMAGHFRGSHILVMVHGIGLCILLAEVPP